MNPAPAVVGLAHVTAPLKGDGIYTEKFGLAGKNVLLTGGTGNLGSHLARGFAEAGAGVILAGRSSERMGKLAKEIGAGGGTCDYVLCDLKRPETVASMCSEAWDRHGGVHVIVHNAVPGDLRTGNIVTTTPEGWASQNSVIFEAALAMFRTLCPRMVEEDGGSIVSMVSTTAFTPTRGDRLAYAIAKSSLLILTKYAAQEFGPKVRANCINPGTVQTHPGMPQTPEGKAIMPRIAAGRRGTSEECVGAALFLASEAASYISGQVINIDGGRF